MPGDTESGWSFPVENGYLGPRSIATLIESVAGHHVTERQIADWVIHHGEVTVLPSATDAVGVRYGISPHQAVATLNELGRQYEMDAELRFASVADLEVECQHGHVVVIEIADAQSAAPTRSAVLSAVDPVGNAVALSAPGATGSATEEIPLSVLEQAWSASNGAMIATSRGPEAGPVLLPVVIDSQLVSGA